jgi:hypothetical protein
MELGELSRIFLKDDHSRIASCPEEEHRAHGITERNLQPEDVPIKRFCSRQ